MKKFILKYFFKISFWIFLIALCIVVFIRNFIDNNFSILIVNYFFWFSFGLASGVYLSGLIVKNYDKLK